MTEKVFIIQTSPGNAFTTTRDVHGAELRVNIGAHRIGPFPSITAAADHLSGKASPMLTYRIETESAPK